MDAITSSEFQHHTPRFYLRGWSAIVGPRSKRIWIYEKDKNPRHAAIKKSGGRQNMYAVVSADGSIDLETVEKYLATIEGRVGKVFPKIFRHASLNPLERQFLSIFISVMYRRDTYTVDEFVPKNLAPLIPGLHGEMRGAADSVSDPKLREKYLAAVEKGIEMAGDNLNSLTSQAILSSDLMGKLVFDKLNWCFVYSETSSFVTSDTPVIFNRYRGIRDLAQGHVLFPISSKILLWMTRWPVFDSLYVRIPDKLVNGLNIGIIRNAHKEVFANRESEEIQTCVNQLMGQGLPYLVINQK